MNIVGLDLSLTSTGWAASDPHENDRTGSIKPKMKGCARLIYLRDEILEICTEPRRARLVVIEGYSFSSRHSQAHKLGELGGTIRVALYEHFVPYVEVAPSARAKYATGKGNASKDAVVAAVAARTGIAFATSDECDAWILRAMALDFYGAPQHEMPAKNREALDAVEWPEFDVASDNEVTT